MVLPSWERRDFVTASTPVDVAADMVAGLVARVQSQASSMGEQAQNDHTMHVLVVEDDPEIRLMLGEILQEEGYPVRVAPNGRAALDLLTTCPDADLPGLILLDLMMPVMDGWTFRGCQLADARLAHIPVVILTAHAIDVDELSPAGFLNKPLNIDALLNTVARLRGGTA
jgi:CheY-like chemotaxis protein